MKKELLMLLCIFLLFNKIYSQVPQGYFKYLDPLPNAKFVNKEATIIINPQERMDKESFYHNGAISLTGTISGICSFQILRSDDSKTIILQPSRPFSLGERVTVRFNSAIRNLKGENIKAFSYDFEIRTKEVLVTTLVSLTILLLVLTLPWHGLPLAAFLLTVVPYTCAVCWLYHQRLLPKGAAGEILVDGQFLLAGAMAFLWHLYR